MNEPQHGIYRVVGGRAYRGHAPGETFVARLDPLAERRAVTRGDIRLLERVEPCIDRRKLALPTGWVE